MGLYPGMGQVLWYLNPISTSKYFEVHYSLSISAMFLLEIFKGPLAFYITSRSYQPTPQGGVPYVGQKSEDPLTRWERYHVSSLKTN